MPSLPHNLRLASLLLAGIAWLVLASGISRALVVCTDACGAEHLTFVHATGDCCHHVAHESGCTHDVATEPESDLDEAICATNDSDACPCHHDGCEDRSLLSDAPLRYEASSAREMPPLALFRSPHVPAQVRCKRLMPESMCARLPCRGGGRDLLVLRI